MKIQVIGERAYIAASELSPEVQQIAVRYRVDFRNVDGAVWFDVVGLNNAMQADTARLKADTAQLRRKHPFLGFAVAVVCRLRSICHKTTP